MSPSRHRARGLAALALLVSTAVNIVNSPVLAAASPRAVPLWQTISVPGRLHPGAMLLLTDGAVMVQDQGPSNSGAPGWWLLTPNSMGSYVDGSWRQIASLPTGYGPISFASAVLPDGRVIIEGGEDNLGHTGALTNLGAVYQPLTNRWTSVTPPVGAAWGTIGDAPSVVLADGTFMLGGSGNFTNKSQALLDPSTLTWTMTGTGQVDNNEEEGFTLLPNDEVLAVGLRQGVTPDSGFAEVYDPTSGTWSEAGTIPVPVVTSGRVEIGPQVLRPNGTVLVVGDTGQNAVFDVATGGWSEAPSFPVINGQQVHVADGPAAVLPDGNVLIDASPGLYHAPSYFFVFNGSTLTRVQSPPYAATLESNWGYMLVLPTGQVLFNDRDGQMEVYNGSGAPNAGWRPVISRVPRKLAPGGTYSIFGRQLNGVTEGASYGDDYQSATNYPLVRLTYARTRRVVYARTFDMSSMAVAPGLPSHASFQVPKKAPAGAATLVVVANGIPSTPLPVSVR